MLEKNKLFLSIDGVQCSYGKKVNMKKTTQ